MLCHVFARHTATLFFLMALILYDFAAYLSTDLIQPGSLMWSVILMPMSVWPRLPSVSISLEAWHLQWLLGPLSDRDWPQAGADYRGANIYPCLRCDNVHNVYDTVSYRACNSGHQYLFYCYRWLCHGAGGVRTDKGIKLMAIIALHRTDCADYWPTGAALMHFALEESFCHHCGYGFYLICWLTAGDARDGEARRGSI